MYVGNVAIREYLSHTRPRWWSSPVYRYEALQANLPPSPSPPHRSGTQRHACNENQQLNNYMYLHVYIYIYMHIPPSTYMCVYIYIYMHACWYVFLRVSVYIYICRFIVHTYLILVHLFCIRLFHIHTRVYIFTDRSHVKVFYCIHIHMSAGVW